ncbi:MAG: orotidine-5'-phosphate decarboxylase [Gammaproteobacteria bacterium]
MDDRQKSKYVVVALDYSNERDCYSTLEKLNPEHCRVKIGKELFTACGPSIVKSAVKLGFDVFLDLKYHDIPNTVESACDAAAELGVWMINVHASGGRSMLEAAVQRLERRSERPLLVAVTVLTSLDDSAIREIGYGDRTAALAERLALLSADCGLDGVVCSTHEISSIKRSCGENFLTVTPGVRPAGTSVDDQKRVATPHEARAAGGDFLVVGRPITQAEDCAKALRAIYAESAVG